jgi:hypothetical protein
MGPPTLLLILVAPKHAAVVLIPAHFVEYQLQPHGHLWDYMYFLRQARWKQNAVTLVPRPTGKYLNTFQHKRITQQVVRVGAVAHLNRITPSVM